eukprot:TRINITY_DN2329_c0_g1_i4.p1 TRINITY_DN2329_c0_g1~~TRINITY_DN2329_c0_g1_i4.p1  ORF type:complete len:118 (-),score=31.44 TRINITY_DN2329_c0_g1_i4:445-798(-)
MATAFDFDRATAEEWILLKTGKLPTTTLGWFRAGVAFYNKGKYDKCIECMKKSVQLDSMNYNAYQVMARACIATNRRDEAITALKMSTKLDNPSDWQLLVELTNGAQGMGETQPTRH